MPFVCCFIFQLAAHSTVAATCLQLAFFVLGVFRLQDPPTGAVFIAPLVRTPASASLKLGIVDTVVVVLTATYLAA